MAVDSTSSNFDINLFIIQSIDENATISGLRVEPLTPTSARLQSMTDPTVIGTIRWKLYDKQAKFFWLVPNAGGISFSRVAPDKVNRATVADKLRDGFAEFKAQYGGRGIPGGDADKNDPGEASGGV